MYNFLVGKDINKNNIVPYYFFYGDETFLAKQFLEDLEASLIPKEDDQFHFEKMSLEKNSWMTILDSAKTIPFFLTSWRIIVVNLPKGKGERLTSAENTILNEFFLSPQNQTILIFILPFNISKRSDLYKLVSSLPSNCIEIREMKSFKRNQLLSWIEHKLKSLKKPATAEARQRLLEIVGTDLGTLNQELEKLATFSFDKNVIELDDVNQVSGGIKSFFEWEITNSLEAVDYDRSLTVLNELLKKEGAKSEYIVGIIIKFFRDLLLAKLWLQSRQKQKKAIFKELRPQIRENYGTFYAQKFRDFFHLVDGLTLNKINSYLKDLENIDLKSKTTDCSVLIMLESFIYKFCYKV